MLIFVIDHEKSRLTQLVKQISEAARAARDAKILEYASAVTAGDAISKWGIPDAVFLDADGWEREGCGFVRSVKEKDPQCRIILISDSDVYAMEAYAMNIERYLLRPFSSERIREEIQLLQTRRSKTNYEENERAGTNEKIRVRCFGSFAVFWQNKPLLFSRKKTVELLAFLVDRAGACCDRDEVMDMLFENDGQIDQIKTKQKLRNLIFDLQSKLALIGQQELLIHSRSMLAVRPDLIDCDYYRYLEGDSAARNEFRGEYMEQFSWAENTKGRMTFQFEKGQTENITQENRR